MTRKHQVFRCYSCDILLSLLPFFNRFTNVCATKTLPHVSGAQIWPLCFIGIFYNELIKTCKEVKLNNVWYRWNKEPEKQNCAALNVLLAVWLCSGFVSFC